MSITEFQKPQRCEQQHTEYAHPPACKNKGTGTPVCSDVVGALRDRHGDETIIALR
jgi:hypothetical protein